MSNRLSLIALSRILRVEATSVRIDKRNLLEARVIVTTYNDHVRFLSPEPWLVSATKVYSGVGADIVMESLQCAGINRHEVEDERALRERSSDPLGPESCTATARDTEKRRQGIGGVGIQLRKDEIRTPTSL